MREIEALVRKQKATYIRFRKSGSSESLDEWKKCRSTFKIRRAKKRARQR